MIIRQPETRTVEDYDSLINALVNQIDKLYISPKARKYCREGASENHEQTANFIQKVVQNVVDGLKPNLSNCPWPFGLPIIKESKGKEPGETEYIQLYGYDCTVRKWKVPEDISAVHTFLALYRDERLGGDRIVTYEIRDICPYIGASPLIMSNTAEMVQKEIPALIRCAREDLIDKGFLGLSSEYNGDKRKGKKRKKADKGRPKIDSDEAERRRGIVERWEGAKKASISRHDFAEQEGRTVDYLKTCVDWVRREKRAK